MEMAAGVRGCPGQYGSDYKILGGREGGSGPLRVWMETGTRGGSHAHEAALAERRQVPHGWLRRVLCLRAARARGGLRRPE